MPIITALYDDALEIHSKTRHSSIYLLIHGVHRRILVTKIVSQYRSVQRIKSPAFRRRLLLSSSLLFAYVARQTSRRPPCDAKLTTNTCRRLGLNSMCWAAQGFQFCCWGRECYNRGHQP